MKKKLKVVFAENALKNVPEEARVGLMEELKALFENGDPGELGKPVVELPEGPRVCPECGGALREQGVAVFEGEAVQFYDCPTCDLPFSGKPTN